MIQAAIAACHATAATAEQTDWRQIEALYRLLEEGAENHVVTLNRIVATALAGRLEAALDELDRIAPMLDSYYLLHAVRADLLRRDGDFAAAAAAYTRALELAPSEPERRFLTRRLNELGVR